MSLFLGCCSQDIENKDNSEETIENSNKLSGKERILKLHFQENFSENIKYFKIRGDKNIYEKEISKNFYDLNPQKGIFNYSNLCLFCGGNNCNSEKFISEFECAIRGLISEKFYDNIFVSQRPSTALIKKYDIINNFKINNIKLIINCQIQGEHPKCGPIKELESNSGYSYSPSCFIEEGIDYLNYGIIEDDCPPTLDFMLDIVKKIVYIIKNKKGKVFIHGHSADGRCCLVLVCFIIFYFNKTADEAIKEIRKKRKNAINSKTQEEYCQKFEIYIKMLKTIFPISPISIDKYIKYQNDISIDVNHTEIPNIISNFFKDIFLDEHELSEIININYIPKIMVKCLDKIVNIKNNLKIKNGELYKLLNEQNIISQNEFNQIILIKNEINKNNWDLFDKTENILINIELLYIWLIENVINCINPEKIEKLYNITLDKNIKVDEILKGNYQINSIEFIELKNIFKNIFSKIELETIKYISIFIFSIYPKVKTEKHQNKQEIMDFKKFLFKLSLILLGFEFDKINDANYSYDSKNDIIAKKFIFILEFYLFYSSNEEKDINKEKEKENINDDWLNDYLKAKQKYESKINDDEDDILLFMDLKPKINLESIKTFI